MDNLENEIKTILDSIQQNLYNQAKQFVDHCSVDVNTIDELVDAVARGKVGVGYHCGDIDCEQKLKEETGIQTRVIISECSPDDEHKCIHCGGRAKHKIYFAKQY